MYKGELAKKEDTFIKRLVKPDEYFLLISGAFIAKKWKRFKRFVLTDYFYMSDTYWEGIKMRPKMDIFLLGFGIMNHYEKQPFTLIYKVMLEDAEAFAELTIDCTTDMAVEEIIYIDFQKLGIAPIRISAEQNFHLMSKSRCSSSNRFNYGYEGYNY